jgi:Holliday junction resolvase RusA-like endonuclease
VKAVLTIPGIPVAKARPRFRRNRAPYKTEKQQSAEALLIYEAKSQLARQRWELPLKNCGFRVSCLFVMPIPRSRSKSFREVCRSRDVYHTSRPDLDNLLKFVEDCLNGIAWRDDARVALLDGCKVYGEKPATHIWIKTLD